jgi:hypothetical protein
LKQAAPAKGQRSSILSAGKRTVSPPQPPKRNSSSSSSSSDEDVDEDKEEWQQQQQQPKPKRKRPKLAKWQVYGFPQPTCYYRGAPGPYKGECIWPQGLIKYHKSQGSGHRLLYLYAARHRVSLFMMPIPWADRPFRVPLLMTHITRCSVTSPTTSSHSHTRATPVPTSHC